MMNPKDPVDQALEALRSQEWAAPEPFNPELENRLMQAFNKPPAQSRFTRPSALALALAVLAVGGVTFAATGGVAKLRSLLLRVEINGQVTEVELDGNGETTFEVDTEDGGTATVHIQTTNSPDQCQTTRIEVTARGDGTEDHEVVRVAKRRIMTSSIRLDYTLDDLGDAKPYKQWTDEQDRLSALYLLPVEKGEGSRIFLVITEQHEEPKVHLVCATPRSLLEEGLEPDIQIGEDGLVTITLDNGEGEVQVMKAMIKHLAPGEELPGDLGLETPNGEIKITIEQIADDDES
jgi:hypothetical protein